MLVKSKLVVSVTTETVLVAPEAVAAIGADLDRMGLPHWQIGQVVPAAGEGGRLHIR